jgi:hypothetical protein
MPRSAHLPCGRASRARLALLALLFLFCGALARAATPNAAPAFSDLRAFRAELQRIEGALPPPSSAQAVPAGEEKQIAAVAASLPGAWNVTTSQDSYRISAEPLRAALSEASADPARRDAHLRQARGWLDDMIAQLPRASASSAPADARARLNGILGRKEFKTVYTESEWDRLKEQIIAWIEERIGSLLDRIGRHPLAARSFFWTLLIAGVAYLAMLVFRMWTRRAGAEQLKMQAVLTRQTWQEWIHSAREAADRGDFRSAIHAVYWAGIVCLEDSGVLQREVSRTPRERLRQLSAAPPDAALAEAAERRTSLSALTRHLERTWYAQMPASEPDFLDSLKLAEALGCKWR